jgi:ABC-2 type transport system ATP-binding protein
MPTIVPRHCSDLRMIPTAIRGGGQAPVPAIISRMAQRAVAPERPEVVPASAEPRPAAIEVEDLHKSYGEHEAVRGISFRVASGEVLALLGPNGAGKTTTVEILEGYRSRTAGTVSVLGMDPAERPKALQQRIGIVLQSCGFYRHLKVGEAVSHWAGLYPSPRDVDDVLELVGLTEQRNQRTNRLSGGQLRRLDLALALVGDPEVIFLDEPTTGFDPAARRAAWETVRGLRSLGKTVLLTTHYLDEAQELADRVAIIKDGKILAEGAPGELRGARTQYRVAYRNGHGRLIVHETDDPTGLLHDLTAEALARGERLEDLSVTHPSLEDVYLQLTDDAA